MRAEGRGCALLASDADLTRRHSATSLVSLELLKDGEAFHIGSWNPQVLPHRLDDCRPCKRSLTTVGEAGKTGKVTSHRIDMNSEHI